MEKLGGRKHGLYRKVLEELLQKQIHS